MVGSNKILTVGYGTFSCTLEGFDDPLETMKAIADYFRDVARDDPSFGAEPPSPDAEELARIAERVNARRVEGRMENGSYVLRPSNTVPMAEQSGMATHAPQEPVPQSPDLGTNPFGQDREASQVAQMPESGSVPCPEMAQETVATELTEDTLQDDGSADDSNAVSAFVDNFGEPVSDEEDPASEAASATRHEVRADAQPIAFDLPTADDASDKPLRARIVRVRRFASDSAEVAGTLAETSPSDLAKETPIRSLTPEQEADLARELAAVAAQLDEDDEDWGPAPAPSHGDPVCNPDDAGKLNDPDISGHSAIASHNLSGPRETRTRAPHFDEDDEDDWDDEMSDLVQQDAPLDAQSARQAEVDEDSVDAAVERLAREGIRRAVKMSSPARVMLTENRIEEDRSSVERILDETNTQLEEPEGNRRRSAIAHLRAAVAATRADRILRRRKDVEKEAEPYRADLASVVRPRRPEQPGPERSGELRPAPLNLMAEQRFHAGVAEQRSGLRGQDPHEGHEAATVTIRPRRVIRDEAPSDHLDPDETGGDFAEFALVVGASRLPDLLEAAAAYISYVQGLEAFSRPQLMATLHAVESAESSREERLCAFDQLVLDGKIEKREGDRFAASERIRFKPDARAVE